MQKTIISKSALETKRFASKLAGKVLRSKSSRYATVLGLVGDLGAGKTTFIQGFIKMLGVKHRIQSPTFLIFRPYPIKKRGKGISYNTVYHVDLYRIRSFKELAPLGFKNILANPRNIVIIEWANKVAKSLPKDTIWLEFEHGKSINKRIITVRG